MVEWGMLEALQIAMQFKQGEEALDFLVVCEWK